MSTVINFDHWNSLQNECKGYCRIGEPAADNVIKKGSYPNIRTGNTEIVKWRMLILYKKCVISFTRNKEQKIKEILLLHPC